jgi:hypothetical protein
MKRGRPGRRAGVAQGGRGTKAASPGGRLALPRGARDPRGADDSPAGATMQWAHARVCMCTWMQGHRARTGRGRRCPELAPATLARSGGPRRGAPLARGPFNRQAMWGGWSFPRRSPLRSRKEGTAHLGSPAGGRVATGAARAGDHSPGRGARGAPQGGVKGAGGVASRGAGGRRPTWCCTAWRGPVRTCPPPGHCGVSPRAAGAQSLVTGKERGWAGGRAGGPPHRTRAGGPRGSAPALAPRGRGAARRGRCLDH